MDVYQFDCFKSVFLDMLNTAKSRSSESDFAMIRYCALCDVLTVFNSIFSDDNID